MNIYLDKKFPLSRDELAKKLLKHKIETRNAFVPANQQKTLIKKYKSFRKFKCPEADFIMRNGIYLPSGNTISNQEIDYVCEIIKKIVKRN